jgi:hypothetical protein
MSARIPRLQHLGATKRSGQEHFTCTWCCRQRQVCLRCQHHLPAPRSKAGHIRAFLLFRQIIEKNHGAKYLVRDFASQILPHSQSLAEKLHKLSKTRGVDRIELGSLWEAVVQALESITSVYCIADALDEMDNEDFNFIDQLLHLGTHSSGRVKMLCTSRPIPKIEDALRGSQVLRLKLEPSLIHTDVAKYVDVRLACLSPSLQPETEKRVKQTICERAQGLFLYIY